MYGIKVKKNRFLGEHVPVSEFRPKWYQSIGDLEKPLSPGFGGSSMNSYGFGAPRAKNENFAEVFVFYTHSKRSLLELSYE
jgi:hypothetical protein